MLRSPYRKEWYVGTSIAKGFIGMSIGERIPTITDYAEAFSCSRGIVQNALTFLEEQRAVTLDKQGKKGTYLLNKNEDQLYRYSGLNHLTGSMPPPVNQHFAGLATAICNGMSQCQIPFTFAFVQGSENRVRALLNGAYDFVVTTQFAADEYVKQYPEIEIAFPFEGCEYALPYKLYINKPNKKGVEDGMTIAVDPTSSDHVALTKQICKGKNVTMKEMPLISGVYAFYTGQIDCIVFRDGIERNNNNLVNLILKNGNCVSPDQISEISLTEAGRSMQTPVALVDKSNYGMAGILKNYLSGENVGFIQNQVISGNMVPQFY